MRNPGPSRKDLRRKRTNYCRKSVKVISATEREALHVIDGLRYHESELRIKEHYTDTGGVTEHVFALCHHHA